MSIKLKNPSSGLLSRPSIRYTVCGHTRLDEQVTWEIIELARRKAIIIHSPHSGRSAQLADALKDLRPGQTVDVEFARDAALLSGTLLLGER